MTIQPYPILIPTNDLILIDERRGHAAAASQGLEVTGTLGILDLAAKRKMIDLRDAIERLKQTNFRHRKETIEGLLAHHGVKSDETYPANPRAYCKDDRSTRS